MKKIMIVMACAFSMLMTSCGDIYQDAYLAEILYKDAVKRNDAMELKYKQDFMEIWLSMTEEERVEYRNYRTYMENKTARMREVEREAVELLSK